MADTRQLPACPHCGYWLRALEGDVCPECGKAINWTSARSGTRAQTPLSRGLKWATRGAVSGAISAGLVLLSVITRRHSYLIEDDNSLRDFLADALEISPAIVFAIFVVSPLLILESRLPMPRILGSAASILSLAVAWTAAEFLSRSWSPDAQAVGSAMAAGAVGVLMLEYCMKLPHRISRRHRVPGRIRELPSTHHDPWRIPLDRAITGSLVGAGAAGLPALALVLYGAPLLRPLGVFDNVYYLCSTLVLWQAGVAAVFGYYSFEPAHPATAASASSQSPCD